MSGPQTGLVTTTDDRGRFTFSAPFSGSSVTIRAIREGYSTRTQAVPNQANHPGTPPGEVTGVFAITSIVLESTTPPVNIAGNYTVTFTADRSCSLPDGLQTRRYGATITAAPATSYAPANTHLIAALSGPRFLSGYDTFDIFVSGNDLTFAVNDGDAGLVEQLAPATYLSVYADATVSVPASGIDSISAPFSGSFLKCDTEMGTAFNCPPSVQASYCSSTHHQLALERR